LPSVLLFSIHHNDNTTNDDGSTIIIVHPFHPENGKKYELIERTKSRHGDRVRCLDERGIVRIFPLNITNLYTPPDIKRLEDGVCMASADDLMSLKALVDALNSPQ
jgi:hypothetical protein